MDTQLLNRFHNKIKIVLIIFVTIFGFICCDSVFAQQTGTSTNALDMLINLSKSYPYVTQLIYGVSYLLGLGFMLKAIYMLKVYGEQRSMMSTQTSLKGPITLIVVSAVLLWLPSALHTFIMTSFGHEYVLGYQVSTSNPLGQAGMYALVYLVQIIGLVSFIRGWVYLAQGASGGQGQHTTGKALTHIIGGLLAINVVELTNILWNSFGFTPPF